MSDKHFGGKTPYEDEMMEIGEELTPDPYSDAPQPVKVHLTRMTMRTTLGRHPRLRKEPPNSNEMK